MKTAEQAAANLSASVAYIPARYTQGVSTANWAGPAASDQAERNYASGVGAAVASKKRQTAVKAVSNTDWQNAAVNKGGAIIGQRITASLAKQSANWAPIYAKVQTDVSKLPPRTTDFNANIQNRVVGTVQSWKKNSGNL